MVATPACSGPDSRVREVVAGREREVVSLPAGLGRPCPHLAETRPTNQTAACTFRSVCT